MSRMRRFQRIIRVCTAERLCTLVVIGADEDGRKHLLAVGRRYARIEAELWWEVLLDAQDCERAEPAADTRAKPSQTGLAEDYLECRSVCRPGQPGVRCFPAPVRREIRESDGMHHGQGSGGVSAVLRLPAEHWPSIRTTNPIESTFATIRHRTRQTRGCLTQAGMLHMICKTGAVCGKPVATVAGIPETG